MKPEELPAFLTEEAIELLAEMAGERPQSEEWHQIFHLLSRDDYRRIMDRKAALQRAEDQLRSARMSAEEKAVEAAKWERLKNDPSPRFHGNMGEPQTLEEYKRKYGTDLGGTENDR